MAQYRTFEALRDACTFTLVVPVQSLEQEGDAKKFGELFPNIKVVAVRCFHVKPLASMRARLRRVAEMLLSASGLRRADKAGESLPYYPFNCLNPDFVMAVEQEFAKGCDIFQAEFAEMLSLGPFMTGRVTTILVHYQLHFVYARRFLEANNATSVNARYLTDRMVREEAAYLNTFDSTIVLSEVDRKAMNSFCPQLAVYVSPCPSPEEPMTVVLSFGQTCKHFVFVASEAHHPNADGLCWFMKEVWPTIKHRLPDAIIEVIGQWSLSAQTSVPNHEDIQFAGFVPELGKALQNKIMIVPVWIGSGIRTKILAAWSASCPVVTTTVGVEGLPGNPGEHFIVADEAPAFASACVELSQNRDKLNQMAANGLALVQRHYSLAAVRKTRLEIYEKLLATPLRSKS